jgi:hypothetical protein
MHRVDIWPKARRLRKPAPCSEASIAVGYGRPQLRIIPQVKGRGYGITVLTMSGRVLLEADLTVQPEGGGVLTAAKRTTYRKRV